MTTPEEIKAAAIASHKAMYHKPEPKRRQGKTPEAKVSAAIDRYLKKIGALSLRTSAGLAEIDGRKIQIGQPGVSDRTVCLPAVDGGRSAFCALEIKATTKLTLAQVKYLERVRSLGGITIVAYSVEDVRQALIKHFGEETVKAWERSSYATA